MVQPLGLRALASVASCRGLRMDFQARPFTNTECIHQWGGGPEALPESLQLRGPVMPPSPAPSARRFGVPSGPPSLVSFCAASSLSGAPPGHCHSDTPSLDVGGVSCPLPGPQAPVLSLLEWDF